MIRVRIQLPAFEHFNWEPFGNFPYNPDLALTEYHCLEMAESQHFNHNELMEGDNMAHRPQTSLTKVAVRYIEEKSM
jgi:uncharacterized protein YuzB (UPF0349 family)